MNGSYLCVYQHQGKDFNVMITNLRMLPLMLERAGAITPCGSFPSLVVLVLLFMRQCLLCCTLSFLHLVMTCFVLSLIYAWTISSSYCFIPANH
jgi:hypothetical protein